MKQLPQIWPEDAARDPWGLDGGAAAKVPTDVCALSSGSTAAPAPASSSYVACKGSKPDTRGFTCGLWLLFHTTAVRCGCGSSVAVQQAGRRSLSQQRHNKNIWPWLAAIVSMFDGVCEQMGLGNGSDGDEVAAAALACAASLQESVVELHQ